MGHLWDAGQRVITARRSIPSSIAAYPIEMYVEFSVKFVNCAALLLGLFTVLVMALGRCFLKRRFVGLFGVRQAFHPMGGSLESFTVSASNGVAFFCASLWHEF